MEAWLIRGLIALILLALTGVVGGLVELRTSKPWEIANRATNQLGCALWAIIVGIVGLALWLDYKGIVDVFGN